MELVNSISSPLVILRTDHAMVWLGNLVHFEREACTTENKVRPIDRRRVVGLFSLLWHKDQRRNHRPPTRPVSVTVPRKAA